MSHLRKKWFWGSGWMRLQQQRDRRSTCPEGLNITKSVWDYVEAVRSLSTSHWKYLSLLEWMTSQSGAALYLPTTWTTAQWPTCDPPLALTRTILWFFSMIQTKRRRVTRRRCRSSWAARASGQQIDGSIWFTEFKLRFSTLMDTELRGFLPSCHQHLMWIWCHHEQQEVGCAPPASLLLQCEW